MSKSKILHEAIIEARALKEAAEKSVKQEIMEELSPLIKKTLESQFSLKLKEQDSSFAIEEEPTALGNGEPAQGGENALPITPASAVAVSDTATAEEVASEPAETLATPEDGHAVNIPLPDASGQITVSIDDLFTKPGDVIQAIDSLPASPEAPAVSSHSRLS